MSKLFFPLPRFQPHPDVVPFAKAFVTCDVGLEWVVHHYRDSLFAFEWLDSEGHIRSIENLTDIFASQRRAVEQSWRSGALLPQPVLGIGVLGGVEIGSGRDVLLTIAAHRLDLAEGQKIETIPVHIPIAMQKEFEKLILKTSARKVSKNVS